VGLSPLVSGQGLTPGAASGLLIVMTVTAVVTSPLVGGFVTRWPYSRSTLILWIVGSIMAVWAVVLLWPGRAPLWLLVVLVVVLAVGGPGSMVGFDLARTFNPPTRLGSATGIVNVGGLRRVTGHRRPDWDRPGQGGAGRALDLHGGPAPGGLVGPVHRVGFRLGPDPAFRRKARRAFHVTSVTRMTRCARLSREAKYLSFRLRYQTVM
jgi:hypothetical protein